MFKVFLKDSLTDFLRNEAAGVSLEYLLLVFAMFAFVTPSFLHYTESVRKLFSFVGSLIR